MQINRLLELVYILLHRKSLPVNALAEKLGVSRRTIYRDIDALSAAGIPIYTGKGKEGGVSLLPDSALAKAVLSEHEQDEILTALHGLSNINVSASENVSASDMVLEKLSAIFNKTVTNWLQVDFCDWGNAHDYFYDLKAAILERRLIEFDYYDSKGDKSCREVEPIQLWFKSKAWYLKGFCLARQDVRVFKLARIKQLVVADNCFDARALVVEPDSLATDGNQTLCGEVITLRIAPEMKYRLIEDFEEDEMAAQPDGSYVITVPWKDGGWVHGFVLSYGEYIEVLEPAHLRDAIKDKVKKIYSKYF